MPNIRWAMTFAGPRTIPDAMVAGGGHGGIFRVTGGVELALMLDMRTETRDRNTTGGGASGPGVRDPLDQYMRSIAAAPILTREQTYQLAEFMEVEEGIFQRALFSIPATAGV